MALPSLHHAPPDFLDSVEENWGSWFGGLAGTGFAIPRAGDLQPGFQARSWLNIAGFEIPGAGK